MGLKKSLLLMGLFDCSLHLHSYKHLYCKSSLFGLHLSDKKRKSRNYSQSKADDSDSTMNSPTAELALQHTILRSDYFLA